MWSVNPGLAATAPANKSADEEGYNTPVDQVYLQVASHFCGPTGLSPDEPARGRIGIIVFFFLYHFTLFSTPLQPLTLFPNALQCCNLSKA